MASSSGSTKVCFNSTCKEVLEVPRQGWLCRTGDFADLCDRCSSAFKDGKFCDTYHMNASGWRCCESCGKQIHCGCIVSFHMFILLDAGGIECLNCAKTEFILTPNPTWPSASHFLQGPAERIRDISSKNWRSISGSGPVPWRQAPSLFNASKVQPEFQSVLGSIDNPLATEQLSSCSLGKSTANEPSEKLVNESWQVGASEMAAARARAIGIQYDGQCNLFGDVPRQSFFYTNELPTSLSSLPARMVAQDQKSEKGKVSGIHVQHLCPLPLVGKQFSNNNGSGPSLEAQAHNAKSRGETRGRNQLLPRYWPRITDQELQQISGGTNAKITPLFEKVLSASDAGRIGRLVLPKKCAEAYLPPISQPEGYPLVVQDLKGKDWVLQFRFWPNNNSRMYVLEGVTPCIQSMQLQAGDTVTFSRLEPEGKLVMGFRKASLASPSDQGNETVSTRNEDPSKGTISFKSRNPDGTWSEVDKISIRAKRKKGAKTGSNCKQLKLNGEEILQLNVTLEQVQELLQPPLINAPTIVVVEGVEFEDYQEAPIIGSPAIFSTNHQGSICSMEVKPTPERLQHMLPMINHASSRNINSENPEPVKMMDGLDALADLAIQDGEAIPTLSQATTRHPRHRPGCTCIVCIQSPSATKHKPTCTCNVCLAVKRFTQTPMVLHGSKDSEKEAGNSVRVPSQVPYADILRHTQTGNSGHDHKTAAGGSSENNPDGEKPSTPFKSQNIDLNTQPEREEESSSPVLESIGITSLAPEPTQRCIRQMKLSINGITDGNHAL
ncbi:B3 domain-containing protein Os07g0563300 isoform X2 [Cynara cardunculus var. scolymus]|uniref:B3 domain-containing protein Os07g0563300 isoform X2 n=1 Tax=Cynara cardunculus var. scolymus TaxID=59895 RepID=UPI000D626810|nr:B3 domain-containing protein Os07g0563300 isoform X2 [Cynara cardunculus var. scolymus]